MKIEKFESVCADKAPVVEKTYSFDEVRETEGIFKPISTGHSSSARVVTLKAPLMCSKALPTSFYYEDGILEAPDVSWSYYKFTKMNERIFMSIK